MSGPIKLWGWFLPHLDWECCIRLEQERLVILEDVCDIKIYFDYSTSDPLLRSFGKSRLRPLASHYSPMDDEDWKMIDNEFAKSGYVQSVESVLMQILIDCADPDGLKRWFLNASR